MDLYWQDLIAIEYLPDVLRLPDLSVTSNHTKQNNMRAVLQRVTSAAVVVDAETVGEIKTGLLVLLGVADGDTEEDLKYVFEKTTGLRIFADDNGKMNLSIKDVGGSLLVVSQFTLLADCKKGRRPSFNGAAEPKMADAFYQQFVSLAKDQGIVTATGRFGADMQVSLCNDGPVTIILDSAAK